MLLSLSVRGEKYPLNSFKIFLKKRVERKKDDVGVWLKQNRGL